MEKGKFRQFIKIRGANEHNLNNISVDIPRNELVVLTGLSGSGKSSLAFDTIYAEGQRRYMESLSSYARQFLGQMEKPNVESIEGLSPAISIDQKSTNRNPRSTVGTVTEIYDYFRLLYARVGIPHCPKCGREIKKQTADEMTDQIMALPEGTKIVNYRQPFFQRNKEVLIPGGILIGMLLVVVLVSLIDNLRRRRLYRELEEARGIMENASNHDFLTGIPNRSKLMTDLEELIRIIDEKNIEVYYNIFLDLYPFKVQSILRKGDMGEYVKYTRQYLETYEKFRQENHRALVGVMELQDRLRNVTLDRENMQASNRVLEDLAMHDELTGLANRTYLHEYLTGCFEHAYAEEKLLGVELMDIDFFKEYNDHYGHLMGDRCLKAIAGVLQKIQIPGQVFCARYGGDEFMIVYTGMTVEQIRRISEDILREVRMLKIPHECSRCSKYVSISQGVFARIPMENNREWDFTSRADELLYKAKNCGRDGICLSTEKSSDKCIEIK